MKAAEAKIGTLTRWPPAPNDPRFLELVRAIARDRARKDHEAEMQRRANKRDQRVA